MNAGRKEWWMLISGQPTCRRWKSPLSRFPEFGAVDDLRDDALKQPR
jgi:hypothetical protein